MDAPVFGGGTPTGPSPHPLAGLKHAAAVSEESRHFLEHLLFKQSSVEVSRWFLDQLRGLRKVETADVPGSQIYQVASALRESRAEKKGAFVRILVAGFYELSGAERIELTKFLMRQSIDVEQYTVQAEACQLSAKAEQDAGNLNRAELGESDFAPEDVSVGAPAKSGALADLPPISRSLMLVMFESGLPELPDNERDGMVQEAKQAVVRLGLLRNAEVITELLTTLDEDERSDLTVRLEDIAPKEQHWLVKRALEHDGYTDQLASTLRLLAVVRAYAFVCIAYTVAGVVFSSILFKCYRPLIPLLVADVICWAITFGAAYYIHQAVVPLPDYFLARMASDEPKGSSVEDLSGLDNIAVAKIVVALSICVLALLAGFGIAVASVVNILISLFHWNCYFFTMLVSIVYASVRVIALVLIVRLVVHAVMEVRLAQALANPPEPNAPPSYGAVDDTAKKHVQDAGAPAGRLAVESKSPKKKMFVDDED